MILTCPLAHKIHNPIMTSPKQLQFAPFNSFLDTGFWYKLSENKLNVYGLDESEKVIKGFYFNGDPTGMPCRMNVEHTAFDSESKTPSKCFGMLGVLYNTNTLDKFKEFDKKLLISEFGKKIWEDITSGAALKNPSRLSRFLLLTFADLKKYFYYYWFAFPCLCPSEDFCLQKPAETLKQRLTETQIALLQKSYDEYQKQQPDYQGYFIVCKQGDEDFIVDSVENLNQYSGQVIFGFADPCTLDGHPGWPLRNYLALIAYHWNGNLDNLEVICLRDRSKDGVRSIGSSLILSVKLTSMKNLTECPKCVGWEKNEKQKLMPRVVNLSSSMDPVRLSESAVDLNLKLMRWRLLPELDLDKVANTKCLLLGAGTLGCNVARCLMGWGVRTITFVDNGKVSYSNPVRQSLFIFDDCLHGGKPKSVAAAESLMKIFPGVNSTGISLSILMPGHSVAEGALETTKQDAKKLDELIQSHDAVFLLLDTRESRWLPTVIAAAKKKIVICSALGFDTFLVMRHGMKTDQETSTPPTPLSRHMVIPGDQLGCYFCNDVVAPGNSTRDRTLDQQCTVSRPGMSYMASALAAELLVSVLQHPSGALAPADSSANEDNLTQELSCPLGLVPHQIRCFLSRFHQVLPACKAFDKCTACSQIVIDTYKKEGFSFLLKAFNESSYLEDLTGLTKMHQETMDAEVWGFSDDDDTSMEMS